MFLFIGIYVLLFCLFMQRIKEMKNLYDFCIFRTKKDVLQHKKLYLRAKFLLKHII